MSLIWQIAEKKNDRLLCYQLRSQEYGRHYNNIPKDKYSDQLDIGHLSDGTPQSFTILVKEEGKMELLGTIRGSIVYRQGYANFLNSEIGMLMSLGNLSGRDLILRIANTPNLNVTAIGEIGKLAVANGNAERISVLKKLIFGMVTFGSQQHSINLWLAIMSPLVARSIRKTGLPIQLVLGCGLNREDPNSLEYIVKHCEYFLPKLTISKHHSFENDISDVSYLKKSAMNCADGVNLYWWTTKQALKCFETWEM